MTTHTTFETSQLLAENGFPQPTPEFGQMWWGSDEECYPAISIAIRDANIFGNVKFVNQDGLHYFEELSPYVFAPTAFDIFKQESMIHFGLCTATRLGIKGWSVWPYNNDSDLSEAFEFFHENPAEACAEAWLFLNK